MTLATHAVVGGSVAVLFPSHPIIAFFAGFFSHFILDSIPHWQYKILSAYANPAVAASSSQNMMDKNFGLDLLRTGADALLGILIVLLVWHPASGAQLEILSLGVIGGILPDFLQFVYRRFPHQPMIFIQKFQELMHAEHELDHRPFLGILPQVAVAVLVIFLVKYLIRF